MLRRKQTIEWRNERDSNPRALWAACFQDRCNRPLCHRSESHATRATCNEDRGVGCERQNAQRSMRERSDEIQSSASRQR